ncbi:hypothetical protein MIR68_009255 [Amoeboaphelidium protococcarum]|nr:hypothetical protein MIR68_009255 [Amoeboaphelidium protococcarum]
MKGKVLSIQSHVVSGYVGNKAAVPALLFSGFDVDSINTVSYSNHTGYSRIQRDDLSDDFIGWKGRKSTAQDISELLDGLRRNQLMRYDYLLTGYVGSADALNAVASGIEQIKSSGDGNVFYVLDPVMGDNGKMYVPEEVLPIYRDRLLQLANVITPNQYEAEWLSGQTIMSESDIQRVFDTLHDKGVKKIVISSVEFPQQQDVQSSSSRQLHLFASDSSSGERFKISFSKIEGNFTGTGDLFSALILAFGAGNGTTQFNLRQSCELALSTVHEILKTTVKMAELDERQLKADHQSVVDSITKMRLNELRLVECRDIIMNPKLIFKAQDI